VILSTGSGPGGRRFKSFRPDQSFQALPRDFWFFVYNAVDDFVVGQSLKVHLSRLSQGQSLKLSDKDLYLPSKLCLLIAARLCDLPVGRRRKIVLWRGSGQAMEGARTLHSGRPSVASLSRWTEVLHVSAHANVEAKADSPLVRYCQAVVSSAGDVLCQPGAEPKSIRMCGIELGELGQSIPYKTSLLELTYPMLWTSSRAATTKLDADGELSQRSSR
jgi:hypothetical protein